MRSAEWQVAAASMVVVADFIQVAASGQLRQAASGQLRLADSDQQALLGFVLLPADSDQLRASDQRPASAHSAHGLPAFHLLPQVRGHSHRGLWYPATMSL
jgi:hypothetical protein